jgi:hypothetical protein
LQDTTGYGTQLLVEGVNDAQLADILASDALGRHWQYKSLPLPFDKAWSFGLLLSAGETQVGYVHTQAARVFPVQPLREEALEEYQFGAILDFPFVGKSDEYDTQCRLLLDAAIGVMREQYTPMTLYCLLPGSAARQAAILSHLGFQPQDRTCLETEILSEHGFEASPEAVVVLRRPATTDSGLSAPDPLRQLAGTAADLQIFSNAQTKIRLQPTLEFWGAIQLYTTYSAYPFIPWFLEQLLTQFNIAKPERLLVAPCAGGDFLRLWPLSIGAPSSALGLDIRTDLLRIAQLRTQVPEIDVLNLALCELLHQVVIRNGAIENLVHEELAQLCQNMHATRTDRSLLRFNDRGSLLLLARSFDEILKNRAIPDWYFPLKVLASADPSTFAAGRADVLGDWLDRRADQIRRAVTDLRALVRDEHGTDIRGKYAGTNLGSRTELRLADLTHDNTIPDRPFDLILCWEFIHVFHHIESLGRFIDSMLDRLAPGGRLVITNIRELSAGTMPHEQEWARRHLDAESVPYKPGFIEVLASSATGRVPFERRLHAHYPVLVINPRGER